MTAEDPCPRCHHSWSGHRIDSDVSPATEGVIYCPEPGCQCRGEFTAPPEVATELEERGVFR